MGVGGYADQRILLTAMKVYSPTLLVLRGGGGVKCPDKKRYVTLEWPLSLGSYVVWLNNVSVLHSRMFTDTWLKSILGIVHFVGICATDVDSYAYFQGCESEVSLHQQTGHFDILVRHVAHVDLKQSRLKTQLEVMWLHGVLDAQ